MAVRRPAGGYARKIEEAWGRLCERPVILSRRDWELVRDWHERGIPFQIVSEAIEAAAGRRGRRGPPRSLAYVAPAVEEAWRVVLEGRILEPAPETSGATGAGAPGARAAWEACRDREPPASDLRRLLDELLESLEQGAGSTEVEARLEARLPAAVSDELREQAEREVTGELEPHRGRMEPDVYATTLRRGVLRCLRRRLGLSELDTDAP